jgi:hypothetical protein
MQRGSPQDPRLAALGHAELSRSTRFSDVPGLLGSDRLLTADRH